MFYINVTVEHSMLETELKFSKPCSRCGESQNRNGRYCKKCHAAYLREWRKTHAPNHYQKIKSIIRSKTKMRIRRGLLIKQPCEVCGSLIVEAHHDDYEKPYDITWLCKKHHQEHHNNMPKVKRKNKMLSLPTEMKKKLESLLVQEEGFKKFPYQDTTGNLTIGVGRNLSTIGISEDEAIFLLENDIIACEREIWRACPWYASLDNPRKMVIIDMCFNMGIQKLLEFRNMLGALESKDYISAAKEMLNSKWANQVGSRAQRLALTMETGVL
jgi:lysozyme